MSGTRLNLSKAQILVVDDNQQALEIMSQILMGIGATRTTKCDSAESARKALAATVFDLAIIDVEMPGESGVELTSWIRLDPKSRNYTLPVILISANASCCAVERARDGGANFVVAKPVAPGTLLDRMEWIARSDRAFVTSDNYRGPDRRFHTEALSDGMVERRAEALNLVTEPKRALSQDEINSLF